MAKIVSRCERSDGCCEVGKTCPVCLAKKNKKQRVRREIRTLSEDDYRKVVAAIVALKNKKSGKNYDYFVAKQMAAYYDSRGSQADYGAHFITWHSLFLLEFEQEILKIDRSIGALPYWDWGDTTAPAFSLGYFGFISGTGVDYQVIRGPYMNFPVGQTSNDSWSRLISPNYTTEHATLAEGAPASQINFYGATTSGRLRNKKNINTNEYLTRPGPYFYTQRYLCKNYNETDIFAIGPDSECSSKSLFPFLSWHECMEGTAEFNTQPWNNISLIRTPFEYVSEGVLW